MSGDAALSDLPSGSALSSEVPSRSALAARAPRSRSVRRTDGLGQLRFSGASLPDLVPGALPAVEARVQAAHERRLRAGRRYLPGRPPRGWLEAAIHSGATCVTIGRALGRSSRTVSSWVTEDAIDLPPHTQACVELATELGLTSTAVLRAARRLHLPLWQVQSRAVIHEVDAELLRLVYGNVVSAERARGMLGIKEAGAALGVSERVMIELISGGRVTLPTWRALVNGNARVLFELKDVMAARRQLEAEANAPGSVCADLPARPPERVWDFELSSVRLAAVLGISVIRPPRWAAELNAECPGAARLASAGADTLAPRIWAFDVLRLRGWFLARAERAVGPAHRQRWTQYAARLDLYVLELARSGVPVPRGLRELAAELIRAQSSAQGGSVQELGRDCAA